MAITIRRQQVLLKRWFEDRPVPIGFLIYMIELIAGIYVDKKYTHIGILLTDL